MYTDIYQKRETHLKEEPALYCDKCGGEIYPSEEYYFLSGRNVCCACLRETCFDLFLTQRRYAPDSEVDGQ